MPYAVELYFDKESNRPIRNLIKILRKNNIPVDEGSQPHISLAIYNNKIDEDFILKKLKRISGKINKFSITFSNVGMFLTEKSVLFYSPVVSEKLLSAHSILHNNLYKYNDLCEDYYKRANWVPHCTIAIDLNKEELLKAIEITADVFIPFSVNVCGIGLLKFLPNQKIEEYPLKK